MNNWRQALSDEDKATLAVATFVAKMPAGAPVRIPGVNLLLLVSRLAEWLDTSTGPQQQRMPMADNAPAPLPPPAEIDDVPSPNTYSVHATEKQVKAIYAIGRAQLRLSETQVDDKCAEMFGVTPNELTKQEASQFIDSLKGTA